MCFKEHQNLESKCELAKEKVDSEHGQNKKYPGPVSRPGYPFHFLPQNQYMDGFTRPRGYRS